MKSLKAFALNPTRIECVGALQKEGYSQAQALKACLKTESDLCASQILQDSENSRRWYDEQLPYVVSIMCKGVSSNLCISKAISNDHLSSLSAAEFCKGMHDDGCFISIFNSYKESYGYRTAQMAAQYCRN